MSILIEKLFLKFDVYQKFLFLRVLMFSAWFFSKKQLYSNRFLSGTWTAFHLCNAKIYD